MGLSGGSETCFVCRRETGIAASSEVGKRNLPGSSGKSGFCFVCRRETGVAASSGAGKRNLPSLPQKRRLCRLPNPEALFRCDVRKNAGLVFRAGVAVSSGPEADGLLRRACFAQKSVVLRMVRRKQRLPAFCAERGAFPRLPGQNTEQAPFRAGTQRALRLPYREGRTVCPCGVCRAFARRREISRRRLRPSALRRTPAKAVP